LRISPNKYDTHQPYKTTHLSLKYITTELTNIAQDKTSLTKATPSYSMGN